MTLIGTKLRCRVCGAEAIVVEDGNGVAHCCTTPMTEQVAVGEHPDDHD